MEENLKYQKDEKFSGARFARFPSRKLHEANKRKNIKLETYWIKLRLKVWCLNEINFMSLLKQLLVPLSIDPQRCSDYQKP